MLLTMFSLILGNLQNCVKLVFTSLYSYSLLNIVLYLLN